MEPSGCIHPNPELNARVTVSKPQTGQILSTILTVSLSLTMKTESEPGVVALN